MAIKTMGHGTRRSAHQVLLHAAKLGSSQLSLSSPSSSSPGTVQPKAPCGISAQTSVVRPSVRAVGALRTMERVIAMLDANYG
eukprot:COSAG06_NODE_2822_length_6230_cov_332.215299_5_plen_83_part_00